jgi:plastocyanin
MRGTRGVATLGLTMALALIGAACAQDQPTIQGGGDQGGQAGGGVEFDIGRAQDHGAADLSGQSETSLELDDFYFEPTVLMGEPGQSLSIELENEGETAHTFTLADQGIDEEVQPGDKIETEVTFPDSGALTFVCRFHQGGGMIGALSVSGDLGATGAEHEEESGNGDSSGSGSGSGDDDY